MSHAPTRRDVIWSTLAGAAAASVAPALFAADTAARPKLNKAVKFGMIKHDGSIEDKFDLIKSLGFEGVEIDSPSGVNREEAVAAKKEDRHQDPRRDRLGPLERPPVRPRRGRARAGAGRRCAPRSTTRSFTAATPCCSCPAR